MYLHVASPSSVCRVIECSSVKKPISQLRLGTIA
jgi:hypothetical protein